MRMEDHFALPVNRRNSGFTVVDALGHDSLVVAGTSKAAPDEIAAAAAHAINCHDELVAELKNMRDRFHNMLVGTGTTPEFAADGVASADAILKKANGE